MNPSSLHRYPGVKGEADVSRHKEDRSESKNGQFGWYRGTAQAPPVPFCGREVFVCTRYCEDGARSVPTKQSLSKYRGLLRASALAMTKNLEARMLEKLKEIERNLSAKKDLTKALPYDT